MGTMPLLNTSATQDVSQTQTGKRPITWTRRVNNDQELLPWSHLQQAEPEGVNFQQDFLEAIGHSEQILNTPPMEQEEVNNTEMAEFESPEMDAEWDMHAELEGLQPSQPTERVQLFTDYDELFSTCVAPTEAEGRVPVVASEVTITNNKPEQHNNSVNINLNSSSSNCELMLSELNRPSVIIPEPMAQDDLEREILADQENNPMLANLNNNWMADFLKTDNFIEGENFLDTFDNVINNCNDITAFPVMVEVKPEPVVPEPEEEKPLQHNILEQAMGQTLYPVDNVSIEVIDNNDDDEEWEEKPRVRKVRKARGSKIVKKEPVIRKKTVGRPARQEPITITEVPEIGLTKEQRQALKYRRMRDLNNEASRKCRKARKAKANKAEALLDEEQNKNENLRAKKQKMEADIKDIKDILAKMGLLPPTYF